MKGNLVGLTLMVSLAGGGWASAEPIHLTVHTAAIDQLGRDTEACFAGPSVDYRGDFGEFPGFRLGSRLERSFLAGGGGAFGTYRHAMPWAFGWWSHRDRDYGWKWNRKNGNKHDRNKDKGKKNKDRDDQGDDDGDDGPPPGGGGGGSEPVATPEPGAMLLVGSGLVAVARLARKRRDTV